MVVQPVDRHIGIIYKRAIYKAYRSEMNGRLSDHLKKGKAEGKPPSTLPSMSPKEKRTLITHVVSETHQKVCSSDRLKRAFIATGTWLPVAYINNPLDEEPEENSQVCMQHLKKTYIYNNQIKREDVKKRMKELEIEENEKVKSRERQIVADELSIWAKQLTFSTWIQKGNNVFPLLKSRLVNRNKDVFAKLYDLVGGDYCVSGSWPAKEICNIVNAINPTMEMQGELIGYERLELVSNDIDVFHGSDSDGGEMKVLFHTCQYHTIDGINEEVNTIKCKNLCPKRLLFTNDINATETTLQVRKVNGLIVVNLFIGGSFWKLLLQKREDRRLGPSYKLVTS